MKSKWPLLVLFIGVLFSAIVFTVYTFIKETRYLPLPVYGQVYDFTLEDEMGEVFSLNKLKGKVWIADFFFTTCSDICPIMTQHMASLNRTFELVDDMALVSITVNPEHDNPAVLKAFADKYKANLKNWHFLTGPRKKIRDIVLNSFKLGSLEEPIYHSAYFCLVDRNGIIRGYYDGMDQKAVNKLFVDASRLLDEK